MIVERDIAVRMRDGVLLRADVYRPNASPPGTDAPVPALLVRTPYDRSNPLVLISELDSERAVAAGFALVCQDVRGRYGSEGEFTTFVHEGEDGCDTVEWIAAQPWCSGAVGMAGRSYAGAVQWFAAREQPPHLKALFPVVIGSDFFQNWVYQGGAFQLGFNLFWALLMAGERTAQKPAPYYRHLPLTTLPILRESTGSPFYFEWLAHPTDDDFWHHWSISRSYNRVRVPAYNVSGWYDIFLEGTLENFARMRREGGSDSARAGTRLLIGPWAHGSAHGGPYPDHSFPEFEGKDALDLTDLQLRFFRRHLHGENDGLDEEPPVRLFVMGENQWRDEWEWPLARTRYERWFLHSDGNAGTTGGGLSPSQPGPELPDGYLYDPNDPVPTLGGPTAIPAGFLKTNSGPRDQRRAEERPDVLVYTSEPLQTDMEVTGPLTVTLHAATTAPDTDFVARLTDVEPEGASRILAEGVLRVRFREGYDRPRLVEPGKVFVCAISLVATSNLFRAGHRIRVAVTSSSFPRFDRNTNTGNPTGTDGPEDLRPAHQTIFHDEGRPSHILLPIIPR